MRTLGIVGGVGPESTIDYYRSLIRVYRQRTGDNSYPPLLINSIDVTRVLHLAATALPELTDYLASAIGRLASGGAEIALIAANTPHIVFDDVARRSSIPLISIVQATLSEARRLQHRRLALFGTMFTMTGGFFDSAFHDSGVALVLPAAEERTLIHDKYVGELLHGQFLSSTREELVHVIEAMAERDGIDGVILAGTELPLLMRESDPRVPLLDTTQIHVEAAISAMLRHVD